MALQDFALRLLPWRDIVLRVGDRYQLLGCTEVPSRNCGSCTLRIGGS
jgi:hypothetical protein